MTMAPRSLPAWAFNAAVFGSGSHTGVAVIVPLVEADHPFG